MAASFRRECKYFITSPVADAPFHACPSQRSKNAVAYIFVPRTHPLHSVIAASGENSIVTLKRIELSDNLAHKAIVNDIQNTVPGKPVGVNTISEGMPTADDAFTIDGGCALHCSSCATDQYFDRVTSLITNTQKVDPSEEESIGYRSHCCKWTQAQTIPEHYELRYEDQIDSQLTGDTNPLASELHCHTSSDKSGCNSPSCKCCSPFLIGSLPNSFLRLELAPNHYSLCKKEHIVPEDKTVHFNSKIITNVPIQQSSKRKSNVISKVFAKAYQYLDRFTKTNPSYPEDRTHECLKYHHTPCVIKSGHHESLKESTPNVATTKQLKGRFPIFQVTATEVSPISTKDYTSNIMHNMPKSTSGRHTNVLHQGERRNMDDYGYQTSINPNRKTQASLFLAATILRSSSSHVKSRNSNIRDQMQSTGASKLKAGSSFHGANVEHNLGNNLHVGDTIILPCSTHGNQPTNRMQLLRIVDIIPPQYPKAINTMHRC